MHPFGVNGVALITGAGSGIGREVAFTFAESGASAIAFADIDVNEARIAAEECQKYAVHPSFRTLAVEVNVTNEESVQAMVQQVVSEFSRIDYCINSAGVFNRPGDFEKLTVNEFNRVYNVNVVGTMICMREVMKAMSAQEAPEIQGRGGARSLGRGSIVNMGSITSYITAPKCLPYVTSKHAVMGMTKSAALEGSDQGIRVNAVCPSFVQTPMTAPMVSSPAAKAGFSKSLGKMGRMALPEEITGAILFLCSPSASYINGTGMIIDAGMSLPCHTG